MSEEDFGQFSYNPHSQKRSRILYRSHEAVSKGVEFMDNVRERMDITFDHKAPSIVIKMPEYYNGYKNILNRGGKIRCITEVTKENISYCYSLLAIVSELRHIDGLKVSIAMNETEYMSTPVLQMSHALTEVIYSNVDELVAQGQYIFDTLWKNSIPAKKKIMEIENGTAPYDTKLMVESNDLQIKNIIENFLINSLEVNICTSIHGLLYIKKNFQPIIKQINELKLKGEHKGINILVDINRKNAEIVEYLLHTETSLRHNKSFTPIDFIITNNGIICIIKNNKNENKGIESIIYSNYPSYIDHFKDLFRELWKRSDDPKKIMQRINESDPSFIETIENPKHTLILIRSLISAARSEILAIFPNLNTFIQLSNIGVLEHIKNTALSNKNINIKILIAEEFNEETRQQIMIIFKKNGCEVGNNNTIQNLSFQFKFKNINNIKIRSISNDLKTEIGFVIVDRKKSIIVESKNEPSTEAILSIGLSSYSNSKRISTSYASIFEALWNQSELNDKLKIHDSLQQEFIHIAAHELKTPVQTLLGYSDLLLNRTGSIENYQIFIDKINKNSKRLAKLIDKILDITQIENDLLVLKKEWFNIEETLFEIVKEYQNHLIKSNKRQLYIQFTKSGFEFNKPAERKYGNIYADKYRIVQVLLNILENSIRFTHNGTIIIDLTINEDIGQIIIRIKDSGIGIHPEILPRLFTKFATNSHNGTGLGLYICKRIIEAHKGKIWAENIYENDKVTGSQFNLSLPYERL